MNYYILLEDEKSFIKVLPLWMQYIGIKCERVPDISHVKENNYVLQSGQGVTQLVTKALFDTIETILQSGKKIDELIIILDSEDMDAVMRKKQVYEKIKEKYLMENLSFKIVVLVCDHCFETWLLGKKGLYPSEPVAPSSFFNPYYTHYNIEKNDPEAMLVPEEVDETIGKYHFHYLHELFRYKNIRYSKKRPQYVSTELYFQGILDRIRETEQLKSFKEFYEYFLNLSQRDL